MCSESERRNPLLLCAPSPALCLIAFKLLVLLQEPNSHHTLLLEILAKELGVAKEDILDFDLSLCDTQAGVIGGMYFCLQVKLCTGCAGSLRLLTSLNKAPKSDRAP